MDVCRPPCLCCERFYTSEKLLVLESDAVFKQMGSGANGERRETKLRSNATHRKCLAVVRYCSIYKVISVPRGGRRGQPVTMEPKPILHSFAAFSSNNLNCHPIEVVFQCVCINLPLVVCLCWFHVAVERKKG